MPARECQIVGAHVVLNLKESELLALMVHAFKGNAPDNIDYVQMAHSFGHKDPKATKNALKKVFDKLITPPFKEEYYRPGAVNGVVPDIIGTMSREEVRRIAPLKKAAARKPASRKVIGKETGPKKMTIAEAKRERTAAKGKAVQVDGDDNDEEY